MADNVATQTTTLATVPGSTRFAAYEGTFSGDTALVGPSVLVTVSGSEGSRTFTEVGTANPLPVSDAGGSLTVDGTVAVSGSVTVATHDVGSITTAVVPGTGATHLGKAEDAPHSSGDVGVMALAVRQGSPANSSGTDGDYEPLKVSAGRLWASVVVDTALPAGTNNIGDVDVLTVPAPLSTTGGGTEATALRVTIASDSTGVVSVDDNGGSLTVDGTVAISGTVAVTQSGTWDEVGINDSGNSITVDDGGGSLTVDGTVAVSGTVTVDSELPAAAALADNAANPTAPAVGAFGMVWDGATWDRAPGTAADGTLVNLGANNDVTVTGTVTANLSATDNAVLDVIASPVATISTTPLQRVAIFDASDAQITSFGGGTQYTEDAAAAANPVGTAPILVRADTPAGVVSADGDNVAQRGTNFGAAFVQVVDSSGNFINTFGGSGGTAIADDADFVAGTTQGTPAMGVYESTPTSVTDGDIGYIGIDANRRVRVSIEADNVGIGGGTQYTEDAAAAANPVGGATILVRQDALSTTTVSADGDNIAARAASTGAQYVEVTAGTTRLGDATNGLLVNLGANNDVTVTGTVDLGATDNAVLDAIAASLVTVDANTDYGAVVGSGLEATALRVTIATDSTGVLSVDDNGGSLTVDNAALAVTGGGTEGSALRVTIANNSTGVVAVTDNGGSLTVDGTVAVSGTVTVGSHAVTNAGTFAVQVDGAALTALQLIDNIVLAEDAAHVTADPGVQMLAVRQSTPANLSGTNGDYEPLQVNAGRLWASATIDAALPAGTNNIGDVDVLTLPALPAGTNNIGDVDVLTLPGAAHDAAISGNPVRVGGRALSADYTAVETGDTADIITTLTGKVVNYSYALPGSTWSYAAASGGITNTTGVTARAAAGAGIRNYITRAQVINGHATVSTDVQIRDGASGTVLWRGFAQAAGGGVSCKFDPPLRGTTNTLVEVACGTTGSATYFNLQGFQAAE